MNVVCQHICGYWQWKRFAVGGVVIAIIDAFAFTPLLNLASSISGIESSELIISLSLLPYIAVMEALIWYKRFSTTVALRTIEDLDGDYELILKLGLVNNGD
jgi:hypothetical protein